MELGRAAPLSIRRKTYIRSAGLNGGYVEATYKYDDKEFGLGTFFPFFKWQYFNGG